MKKHLKWFFIRSHVPEIQASGPFISSWDVICGLCKVTAGISHISSDKALICQEVPYWFKVKNMAEPEFNSISNTVLHISLRPVSSRVDKLHFLSVEGTEGYGCDEKEQNTPLTSVVTCSPCSLGSLSEWVLDESSSDAKCGCNDKFLIVYLSAST